MEIHNINFSNLLPITKTTVNNKLYNIASFRFDITNGQISAFNVIISCCYLVKSSYRFFSISMRISIIICTKKNGISIYLE